MSATVDALTAVPPAFVVLAVALIVPFVSRRAGHALGFAATLAVVPWALTLRSSPGAYLDITYMGFDVVLLYIDEFSVLMAVIFGAFGAAAVAYSYYVDASRIQTAIALTYVGTSIGAVLVGDWLTLVFFWELMAVTSTVLVWHHGGKAVRAGYRYALLHGIGGSVLILAVVLHYIEVGTVAFGGGVASGVPQLLAALGIGVNVGFIGLHAWIPDTYPRPHIGASVFLCALTTKTGVYAMYRAFPDGNVAIAYMGGAMAVYGVFYALLQKDMRRLLSYHIQAQVGYMMAGIGVGTAFGAAGAMGHLFNNILYKGLLFMCAGVIIYRTGENSLKKLGGLWREMPFTFVTFTVAALSITAFPGFNGYVSKGMVTDAVEYSFSHNVVLGYDVLWWLLMLGAVGTFMSFIKFGYYAFFHGESDHDVRDANLGQRAVMASVATACIFFGVFYGTFFDILPAFEFDSHPYSASHVEKGLILAALGAVGFVATKRALEGVDGGPDVDSAYNPVVFYGTRLLARGTTKTYAAVDSAVVSLARFCVRCVNEPGETVRSSLPEGARKRYDERVKKKPGATGTRAGISESVLIVVVVLAVVLYLFL